MNPRTTEAVGIWTLRTIAYTVVLGAAYVLGDIVWRGSEAITWEFLTASPRDSGKSGGIFPAIVGTFWLVAGTLAIALPVGVGAAVWLSEYAGSGPLTNAIRLGVVTLAGVPSIVFGLFGMGLFVYTLKFGQSIAAGCLTLAMMILPVIIVASEEALRAVPQGFRDAGLALGSTKWQSIRLCVLPYALPGMLTGSILGIARAAGETAPILLTVAAFFLPKLPGSLFDQVMALPYHLYILATQHPSPDVRPKQYGTALVLIALVLGVNALAIIARNRLRKSHRW